MNSDWYKPNAKGLLLYASALVVALNLLPMPQFRYSAMDFTGGISWPRPWALAAVAIALALYALSMRAGRALPRQGAARSLTGPCAIVPLGVFAAAVVGLAIYEPPELHGDLERHLFLQGSTDLGGGTTFAAVVALYVLFGFTAAWHLVLVLARRPPIPSFGRALLAALWTLKFHLLVFAVAGTAPWSYDARVAPNDFRNLFLLAACVYAASIVWIVVLRNLRLPLPARLALAPLFTALWLVVGSDGNTARAGQHVCAGQNPHPIVRGARHGLMLRWHRLCDDALGDIPRHPAPQSDSR